MERSTPFRVMMVCTGNICRSPIAEVVLRQELQRQGIDHEVIVDSTGVSSEEVGNPMDYRAQQVLKAAGYEDLAINQHRARKTTGVDLGERDLVLAMTRSHYSLLNRLAAREGVDIPEGRIKMFRSFDPDNNFTLEDFGIDVADPWYGGIADFEVCLEEIQHTVKGIISFLKAQNA